MNTPVVSSNAELLISKLIEIGNAAGREDTWRVRFMVAEAQNCALQMQLDMLTLLRENEKLRRITGVVPTSPATVLHFASRPATAR